MKTKITFIRSLFLFLMLMGNAKAQGITDGTLDNSFNIGTGFSHMVTALAVQPDGKLLVLGSFNTYNGQPRNSIIRVNANGSLDTTFNVGTGFPALISYGFGAILVQSDGKILVGRNFTTYNGQLRNRIIRLNSNGSIDTTFNIGTGFNDTVHTIVIQSDGKILVAGDFTAYNGQARNRIVRLNTNGSIDTTFNKGTGFDQDVFAIGLQSDGKILAGGDFLTYNGQARKRIIRLNSNGSIDTSFNIGTGANESIATIALQSDGKILAGGNFTNYNGILANRIVRLLPNGTKDPDFHTGTGFDHNYDKVNSIVVQPNGKILVAGKFDSYSYWPSRNGLVRLNINGGLDNYLNIGGGFTSATGEVKPVLAMTLQPDGKLFTAGEFTVYDGQSRNHLVRLHNQSAVLSTNDIVRSANKIYPNPVKDILYFDKKLSKISITDLTGKLLSTQKDVTQTDMSTFQKGIYLITIENENEPKQSIKLIKE